MIFSLKRGNERGFSFQELLIVISVIAIIGAVALGFYDAKKRRYYRTEKEAQRVSDGVDEARSNAKAGEGDETKRSFSPAKFKLTPGIEWVRGTIEGLPAGVQVIQPETVVTFERQSGRTANEVQGMLILRDNLNDAMIGIRIAHPYSPPARYIKQPGWAKFELMSNAVRGRTE